MGILRVKLWVFLMMAMVWLWSGYGSLLADLKKNYVFLNTYAEKIVFFMLNMVAITSNYEQLRITTNYGYFLSNCVSERYFSKLFLTKSLQGRATTGNSQ